MRSPSQTPLPRDPVSPQWFYNFFLFHALWKSSVPGDRTAISLLPVVFFRIEVRFLTPFQSAFFFLMRFTPPFFLSVLVCLLSESLSSPSIQAATPFVRGSAFPLSCAPKQWSPPVSLGDLPLNPPPSLNRSSPLGKSEIQTAGLPEKRYDRAIPSVSVQVRW